MASVEDATQTTQTQQPSWHVQAVQAGPHGLPPLTALDDDIPTSLPPQESLLPASYLQSHASPIKTTVKGSDEAEDAGIIDASGAGEGGGGLLPSPTSQSEVVNLPAFEHATPSAITVIAVATAASAEGGLLVLDTWLTERIDFSFENQSSRLERFTSSLTSTSITSNLGDMSK